MKQLMIAAVLMTCMGCASTPEVPAVTPTTPEVTSPKIELIPLFTVNDLVTITFMDETTADGTIVKVGPITLWTVGETKEQIKSRIYMVRGVVNGQNHVGEVPEFALTKRNK